MAILEDLTPLYDLAAQVMDTYISYLEQYKVNASGELTAAARSWNFALDGDVYRLTAPLPKQWYFVEYGRNPSSKMPPVEAIERWIQVKRLPIQPRANGKIPSTRQVAFAIAKKIQKEGFYSPGHQGKEVLSKAIEDNQDAIQQMCNIITRKANESVLEDISSTFNGLKTFK